MESMLMVQQKQDEQIKQLVSKVDVFTTYNKILEAQISQQASSSFTPFHQLPRNLEPNSRKHCNAMILRGSKKLERPKKVGDSVSLHDENAIDKEVHSPSSDVHNDVVTDTNEAPNDPEHTSPIAYTLPLPFSQRMAKAKLDQ